MSLDDMADDMVDETPATRSILSNLQKLLDKARKVKQSDDIDPPLQSLDFEHEVINIAKPQPDLSDDNPSIIQPQHAALETAARHIFYGQLAAFAQDDGSFVDICNLLDILQFCADKKQCDASLPLWLVEELLDSQTIGGCKRVFDYLESRRERMITDSFHKNKQMIVLRSCNELLRRLSRAEDAVSCGRVFMFLFQSFPLGDKSSVNLRGEFHVENTTTFDAPGSKSESVQDVQKMDTDVENKVDTPAGNTEQSQTNGSEESDTKQTTELPKFVVDNESSKEHGEASINTDALYCIFWSLQSVFSNPTKIFVTEEFDAFKKGLDATINKFKSTTKVLQTHGTSRPSKDGRQGVKRKRNRDDDELASNFNPKYLTSRDLFELEMSDLTFQRHILVQALILIDFLLSLTPKFKKKLAELKAQKAMVYNYTLSTEDANWATTTRNAISAYLQEGPEGKFYYRMIDNVLSRDKNWVRWKTESCPPISLPALPTNSYTAALNGAKRACAPRRLRATPMGALDLGFLTEETGPAIAEKRLALLREPVRYTPPSTETYLAELGAVDLDLEMADGADEKMALGAVRASKTWRVLRLAAKTRLKALGEVDERGSLAALAERPNDTTKADEGQAAGATSSSAETNRDDARDAEDGDQQSSAVPQIRIDGEESSDDNTVEVETLDMTKDNDAIMTDDTDTNTVVDAKTTSGDT